MRTLESPTTYDGVIALIRELTDRLSAAHAAGDPGWGIVRELDIAYQLRKRLRQTTA